MEHKILQLSAAVLGLISSAACTCEVSLGPGASDKAPPTPSVVNRAPAPVVTQQASAIDPAQKVLPPPAPEPTGTLSDASVRKTEARHHGELRFCMENGAAASESPKLRIQFLVMPDGSVDKQVDVLERSDASDGLAMCLIQALKRWKFEAPKGGPARATLTLKR